MNLGAGTGSDDHLRVYAVRAAERAAAQIEAEQDRLQTALGRDVAEDWAEGMADAIASLATYPERCVVAAEDPLFQKRNGRGTLRQLLY